MPCEKVRKKPGRKNVQGVTAPEMSSSACSAIVAIASSAPASTIDSFETRVPIRLDIKLPKKKPSGNNRKYRPNSLDDRCSSSFISVADALAMVMNAAELKPLCNT